MRAFILLGSVLPVLFVLGYPESTASLEGRDLPSPHSVQPVQQLSKRKTSLPNLVVCPGPDGPALDMNNYNKMLTALVSRKAPCVYFANMAMAVFDRNGGPAAFTDSEPSYIRNWYDSQLSQRSNACLYPAYMHDASSTWAMEVVGHNQIVEPGVNGEVDVVHDSNVHVPSNVTTPPSEEGNVESESFGLKGGDVDAVHDSNGHVVPGMNGEEVGGCNQVVEPGVNGEVDVVRDSNGHVPSNATAPPSEEGKVGSGLKGGDVDAVPDNNGHVEPGVNGEVDAVHDSNGHVPSNATTPPSEESKVGNDAFGLKGGDVDAVPDINGHFEPDVNGEEVGGYNQIVEPNVNGEEDAFGDSNGHVPSNATAPPSEERKVGSNALGYQGSNDGALANGIE